MYLLFKRGFLTASCGSNLKIRQITWIEILIAVSSLFPNTCFIYCGEAIF